jgi:hypothetical protein
MLAVYGGALGPVLRHAKLKDGTPGFQISGQGELGAVIRRFVDRRVAAARHETSADWAQLLDFALGSPDTGKEGVAGSSPAEGFRLQARSAQPRRCDRPRAGRRRSVAFIAQGCTRSVRDGAETRPGRRARDPVGPTHPVGRAGLACR